MVSRNALRWTLATLTLLGASSVSADPINFTGFVENDFNKANDPNDKIRIISVDPDPLNRITQLPQMTAQNIINGYAIKDMRLQYDKATDTLSVGLNTYSIAGSAIGNGGPDIAKALADYGGVDPAHIGGLKSITVAFAGANPVDSNSHGPVVAVAGIPSDKSLAGPGLIGFNVAAYNGSNNKSLQNSYGATLTNNLGTLAFDPSAAHPGFEFTIKNFSHMAPGVLDPKDGFWVAAYAGSPNDNPIGEESSGFLHVPSFGAQVPEPATVLSWTIVAAAAGAVRLRRRRVV
ncbi:PEP-CTERM protein-sorting domain-containing protein [Singulisphaera sp. GP187]|uniref:hypothetical protein n=1 Tax=Singulisphaera sp. GP187 TaxID=1882752 RepID=UPI000925CF93|nr:hypothetical protein [Singulisphaera sp. GP187]SIO59586.1 PEP-CTERM protein-sorting domain-containing protein [Singulisphaera sp. GP187]